jgi:hypothetical protein
MNIRSLTVSPYAMMAALTDDVLQSTASRLLCELVRSDASEEALIAAALLTQEQTMHDELNSIYDIGKILEQESMGYLFFGVVRDPEYQQEIAEQRANLHPAVRMPSTAEYCVTKAAGEARAKWMERAGTVNERVHAAYVGALDIAIRRCLRHTVRAWAEEARAEQWDCQRNENNHTHDYAADRQRGYAQMRLDLELTVLEMLELEERRAMVLEKDGALPRR